MNTYTRDMRLESLQPIMIKKIIIFTLRLSGRIASENRDAAMQLMESQGELVADPASFSEQDSQIS